MNTMKFRYHEEEYDLFLVVDNYISTGNIAIELYDKDIGAFADLTVNICDLPEGLACIDINNFPEAINLIKEYNLGEFTNNFVQSGFCSYPVYKLNMENIWKYREEVE